jgi:Na+/H+-dicarboxylate symporter
MCRTIVNITGDATVSMIVAKYVEKSGDSKVNNGDDNYKNVKG